MEAGNLYLDESLIAVRCTGAARGASARALVSSEGDEDEFLPRMCCNDASLTGSGGDFSFTGPEGGAKPPESAP